MKKSLAGLAIICSVAVPADLAADPTLGAHAMSYRVASQHDDTEISTPPMMTNETGSTIVVGIGRGNRWGQMVPYDNMGNGPYQQLGETQQYSRWPAAGTDLYASAAAAGGDEHVVTVPIHQAEEGTVIAVEVAGGGRVQDYSWTEVLSGTIISDPVTTTGPATLVAFWWGDGGVPPDGVAASDGFVVIETMLEHGWVVQGAAAVRDVDSAGTYDVTWTTSDPQQGAQLWLVAVEEASSTPVPDVSGFSLHQNFPNPFNPQTNIGFHLPRASHTSLRIYSIDGRLVRTLLSGEKPAGEHLVLWDGRDDTGIEAPSGTYFSRLEAGDLVDRRTLVLLK